MAGGAPAAAPRGEFLGVRIDVLARVGGESLRRAAHGLKGAAANFDADGVVSTARALEAMGRTGEFDAPDAAWQTLAFEMDRLISVLRVVCN